MTDYDEYFKDPVMRKYLIQEDFFLDITEQIANYIDGKKISLFELLSQDKYFMIDFLRAGDTFTLENLALVLHELGLKIELKEISS